MTRVVGHRGAAGRAPENTRASFRRAWQVGAQMVELDVRLTADGHAVALHDATLDRTTNGRGPLAALTLAEVRALDAGSWFGAAFTGERVPTLEEVLEIPSADARPHPRPLSQFWERGDLTVSGSPPLPELGEGGRGVRAGVPETRWLIELKAGDDAARLVAGALAAIETAGAAAAVRLISFDEAMLAEARRQAPAIPRGIIAGRDAPALLAAAARHACVAIHPSHALLDADLLAAARAAGYLVNTWTVNTAEEIARAVALGVDEITTDYPDLAVTAVGAAD